MCTEFGTDSSSVFLFRRKHTNTETDTQTHTKSQMKIVTWRCKSNTTFGGFANLVIRCCQWHHFELETALPRFNADPSIIL